MVHDPPMRAPGDGLALCGQVVCSAAGKCVSRLADRAHAQARISACARARAEPRSHRLARQRVCSWHEGFRNVLYVRSLLSVVPRPAASRTPTENDGLFADSRVGLTRRGARLTLQILVGFARCGLLQRLRSPRRPKVLAGEQRAACRHLVGLHVLEQAHHDVGQRSWPTASMAPSAMPMTSPSCDGVALGVLGVLDGAW